MQCWLLLLYLLLFTTLVLSNDIRRCSIIQRGRYVRCEGSSLKGIPRNIPHFVEQLTFRGNELGELTSRTFPTLQRLKKLFLIDNKITHIGNGTFTNLPNLEYLYIYRDGIQSVAPAAFHGLRKLKGLRFYMTKVKEFPDYAFKDSSGLEEVFLNNNQLTTISSKLLHPLRNVGSVILNHNQIHSIEDGAFKHLHAAGRRTTRIVLSDNMITSLQAGVLDRARSLKIFNNPFHCDCHLVIPRNIGSDTRAACASPPNMAGKVLHKLRQSALVCVKACPVPIIANGHTMATNPLQPGQVLEMVCNAGYELSGSEDMVCGNNGAYNTLNFCEETEEEEEVVDNLTELRTVLSAPAEYPNHSIAKCPGSMVMIACQCVLERCGGALINDQPSESVCIAVSTNDIPATANATCAPAASVEDSYTFERVEDIEHRAACRTGYNMTTCSNYIPGVVVGTHGLVPHPGPLCALDCGDNECNMYINCVKWREPEARKSCELFGILHAILNPPIKPSSEFLAGDNITISCIDGYRLIGTNTVSCIEDDWYEPEYLPWCEKVVTCDLFGIEHAILIPKLTRSSVFVKGDTIKVECMEGYSLFGSSTIKCVKDDLYSPEFLPFCEKEKAECSTTPLPNTLATPGWVVPKDGTLTLTCLEGYTASVTSFSAVCRGTGHFEPALDYTCAEIPKATCAVPLVANVVVSGVTGNKATEGSTVTFVCSVNYSPAEPVLSDCLSTGLLSLQPPTCTEDIVDLCRVPLIKYGRVEGYLPGDVIQPGRVLNIVCNGSYVLDNEITTLECVSEQHYQPDILPRCVPKDVRCEVPGLLNGFYYGYRSGQLILEGEQLTPGCHVGYTLSGPHIIICDNGVFPGLEHFCLKPQLACVVPTVLNGKVITNGRAFKPPEEFPVLCDNGYQTLYNTIACVEAPNMYDPFMIPECTLPHYGCAKAAFPHMIPVESTPKPGQTISVTCEEGYRLYGDNTITCGYGNQYTGDFPTCVSYTGCEVPSVDNGVTDAQLDHIDNNTSIHISCMSGYELYGDVEMTCVDGVFNTLVNPACIPKADIEEDCELPFIDNGVVLVNGMINPGSTLTILCDTHYTLQPDIMLRCITGSEFSPSAIPECVDSSHNTSSTCLHLTIPNGYFIADNELETGDYATVSCQTNYNLVGSSLLRCVSGSNYFAEVPPVCEKEVKKCSEPTIANANVAPSTSINPGDKFFVQCNEGYDMEGDMIILCLEDGTTQPPPQGHPTCTEAKAPCMVPFVDNGNVIGSLGIRSFPVGHRTWVSCDTGYEPSQTQIMCVGDNMYRPPVPTCVMTGATCEVPEVANGTVYGGDNESVRPDTVFTVVCDIDFTLEGAQHVTCQDNGEYSPALPHCLQTTFECEPGPSVQHATIIRPKRLVTDDRFSVECDEGYMLNGTKYLLCVRGDTYSDKLPTCVKKEPRATECRPLFIQNANIRGTSTSTTLAGNSVSIFCDEGYQMIGPDTLYCDESGMWDKDSPQCIALPEDVDITAGCGMRNPEIPRIFGGEETEAGNYPWNVFIQFTRGKFCGGSIVNENWVMTAGHCFVKRTYDKCDGDCTFVEPRDIIAIKAGVHMRSNMTEDWQVRTAAEIHVHPQFKMQANYIDFDVGLIRVNKPFEYNNRVNRVCLPQHVNFVTNQFLTITGWGRTNRTYTSDVLQKVDVPYVPRDVCNSNISYKGVITDTMFCAGYQVGRKDACQGDSGGPIVYLSANGTFVQGGIVSWGNGCGQENFYGVYSNLSLFYNWIIDLIIEN